MLNQLIFSIKTVFYISYEYLCYKLGKNQDKCIQNIIHKLAKLNILYIKIFQGLANNSSLLTNEQNKYL